MFRVWQKWIAHETGQLQPHVQITLDESARKPINTENDALREIRGIHAIDVGYKALKPHLARSKAQLSLPPPCVICRKTLPSDGEMSLVCPNTNCTAVGHVGCFAAASLSDDDESLVPIEGECPECGSHLRWIDLVKELSLRMRAPGQVDKILKEKKTAKAKANERSGSVLHIDHDSSEDEGGDIPDDNLMKDEWNYVSDSSENGIDERVAKSDPGTHLAPRDKFVPSFVSRTDPIIEDSDWDDAEVII